MLAPYLREADTLTLSNRIDAKQNTLVNSAGLAAALSDETGSGLAVFSTSPTLTGTTVFNNTGTTPGGTTGIIGLSYAGVSKWALLGMDSTSFDNNFAILNSSDFNLRPFVINRSNNRIGMGTGNPARTLHVSGEARISDLQTDTPTRIVGADADGDLGQLIIGTGLSLVGDTLTSTGGSGVADGDKGDIDVTSSGTVWTIDTAAVTKLKLANNSVGANQLDTTAVTAGSYVNPRITVDADGRLTAAVSDTMAMIIACSDEKTDLDTATAAVTFRAPFAFTVLGVRANVNTAPAGAAIQVDINETGVSILSTKITIDASEKTSLEAGTAPVISDSTIANDAEVTIDIDQVGTTTKGKSLKVTILYRKN
jgi:hypothetical protein